MTEVTIAPSRPRDAVVSFRRLLVPHRIALSGIFLALVVLVITMMRWDWIPQYSDQIVLGLVHTVVLLTTTATFGMVIAILLGFAQAAGPPWLRWFVGGFCGIIRGTPLLLQIWLLYYGLGSLLVEHPEVRSSFLWPFPRQAWPYGFIALTISFAAYEGEVMRGAF